MDKIFINGYGNIGRRLATALSADKEIEFIGIAKYTPDERTKDAVDKQFDIYVPNEMLNQFKAKRYQPTGTISEAIHKSDFVVDAAKEGGGFDNKRNLYEPMKKPCYFPRRRG